MTFLERALSYAAKGWPVFPLKPKSKEPATEHGFKNASLDEAQIERWWTQSPDCNIGFTPAETDLFVVDIDPRDGGHLQWEWFLDENEQPPDTIEQWSGSNGRHLVFRHPAGMKFKKDWLPGIQIIKLGYIVVAPSIHPETGREYAWKIEDEPALAPVWLLDSIRKEEAPKNQVIRPEGGFVWTNKQIRYAEAAMQRELAGLAATPEGGRNDRLNRICFKLGQWAGSGVLDAESWWGRVESAALEAGLGPNRPKGRPREIRDCFERGVQAGSIESNWRMPPEDRAAATMRPEDSGRVVLDSAAPMRAAEAFLDSRRDGEGRLLVRRWRDTAYRFEDGHYIEWSDTNVRDSVWSFHDRIYTRVRDDNGKVTDEVRKQHPSSGKVSNVIDALGAAGMGIDDRIEPPCWLRGDGSAGLIPCTNGLVELATGRIIPSTPDFFTTYGITTTFDAEATCPEWLRFLASLDVSPDDIAALQEWFGYCLWPDTSQQKMLMLIGVKRSGKGTIARTISSILGRNNICGPSLGSLAGSFGLQPLLGKLLAIVGDARMSNRTDQAQIVESLLSISGEDTISVHRKHKEALTVKMSARMMLLSNEIPVIRDPSGVLASRFIFIQLRKSFFGQEDSRLEGKLFSERSGILNWAIEGWRRYIANGRLTVPSNSGEVEQDMMDLGSLAGAFIRHRCSMVTDAWIASDLLWEEYSYFCNQLGTRPPGDRMVFFRDLNALAPNVKRKQRRVDGLQRWGYEGITTKGALQ